MKKRSLKLFVVRKYIMAKSAQEAIKKDKTATVDDVWVDDSWKEKKAERLESAIGFLTEQEGEIYEHIRK